MVSRHFWPHLWSDAACRDLRLADALHRAGLGIEVLTPRYSSAWPERLTIRELPVERPLAAPQTPWSVARYQRHLQSWLTANAGRFDIVFCTRLGEEFSALMQMQLPPSVCRVGLHSGTGDAADHRVWASLRGGKRMPGHLAKADAVVVSWASAQRALLAIGTPVNRMHRIDIGVISGATPADRDASVSGSLRRQRQALAEINGDLELDRDSQVILVCGQMGPAGITMSVAKAFPGLLDTWPDLRLWLIGDGPLRERLHAYFRHQSIRQNVAMPGTFVDFEELFAVADLVVVPSPADALEDTLPAAVAAAVPLVVPDSPDTRAYFAGLESLVEWFNSAEEASLERAIRDSLIRLGGRRIAARNLRRELLVRRPYQQTVTAYKRLFDSLADANRERRIADSVRHPAR